MPRDLKHILEKVYNRQSLPASLDLRNLYLCVVIRPASSFAKPISNAAVSIMR